MKRSYINSLPQDNLTTKHGLNFIVLIIRVFARKTLNNGSAKAPKASYDDGKHRENSVQKSTDIKLTKRQRLLQRGGKSSPAQQRLLLMCVPQSDLTEEDGRHRHFGREAADYKVADSDSGNRDQGVQDMNSDLEVEREKLNCTDKSLTNERYVECRRLNENAVQRNSFDESLMTRSESEFALNTESTDQDLLEEEPFRRSDKMQSDEEKCRTVTQNNCGTCKGLLNDDKHNRVICTAL